MAQSTFTPLQWKNGINPKNPASFGTFTRQLADWANNTQNLLASGGAAGPAGPAGPPGPSAVSTDANNKATLGSDSLILVQGVGAGASATTHAQTVSGDDPQLTNARTPTAHAATHLSTGSDPIALATTAAAGLCPPPDGTTITITSGKLVATASGGAAWFKAWMAGFEGFPTATNYAVFSTINSSPYQTYTNGILSSFLFLSVIPPGTSFPNGVLIRLKWTGNSAGNVIWTAQYERFGIATVASDAFGTAISVTTTAAATNIMTETDITIPLANMGPSGGATAGEAFRLKINRPASGGTMASAAYLWLVSIQPA